MSTVLEVDWSSMEDRVQPLSFSADHWTLDIAADQTVMEEVRMNLMMEVKKCTIIFTGRLTSAL